MIWIFTAISVYFLYTIIYDTIVGPRFPKQHFTRYFNYIRGNTTKKQAWSTRILRLDRDQLNYAFNTRKYLFYALPVCLGLFVFFVFFFRTVSFAAIVSLIGLFYPRYIIIGLIRKRKQTLTIQLKEAMFTLNSSLLAGLSLTSAIERSVYDLERLYHNQSDAPILHEFKTISMDIKMGYSIEEALEAFRDRVQLEDVDDFVNATLIAKSRGGNMTEVFSNIAKVISEKIDIQNEIKVMTAGKRMEAKILSIMPIAIVGCLTLLSPEYMEPMYSSWIGRLLMVIGFVLIGLNYFVSRKIVDISI